MMMRKKKVKISQSLWIGLGLLALPWSSHARFVDPCLHCCEPIPLAADIQATLALALWDPASGRPLWRVLREMQATRAINTENQKTIQKAASEGLRNGLIAYNQEKEQLKLAMEVERKFPLSKECSQMSVSPLSEEVIAMVAEVGAHENMRRQSFESPNDMPKDIKDRVIHPKGAPYSGSMISRPGCKPVFDPAITAFETKIPVAIGWECEGNGSPKTISRDAVNSAQAMLTDLTNPTPLPVSWVSSRKTPAGQTYESLSNKYTIVMDMIGDMAQTSLARYVPTVAIPESLSSMLVAHGVDIGVETPSWMEYISKWNQMKFDNPVDQQASYGVPSGETSKQPPIQGQTKSPLVVIGQVKIGKNWDRYDGLILQAAQASGVDPFLIKAHMANESSFNPNAIGAMVKNKFYPVPSWAGGLAQFMPPTASKEMGLKGVVNAPRPTPGDERFIPEKVIPAMGRFIRKNVNAGHGDIQKGILAYFTGRNGGWITGPRTELRPEEEHYIKQVKGYMEAFRKQGLNGAPPPPAGVEPETVADPMNPDSYANSLPVATESVEFTADGFGGFMPVETLRGLHIGQLTEQALWMELYKIENQRALVDVTVQAAIQSIDASKSRSAQ